MQDRAALESVELLQELIRNACVSDGSAASGQEHRNAAVLANYLDSSGIDIESFEPAPGRTSLVARIEGSDAAAPALCLMGHTDVVPVEPDGWHHDPFGGELIDGEVWGRGAIDMLNLTASMAVATRYLAADRRFRPRGDLIFLAVADEESGGTYGSRWLADNHWDAIACDYVLTEGGGLHGGTPDAPVIVAAVAEKGVSWRRLTVRGEPGHGSMPFGLDSAMVKAATVVHRLAAYAPAPHLHEFWRHHVDALPLSDAQRDQLRRTDELDDALSRMNEVGRARHLHACSHTTFAANVISGGQKTNVVPDHVDIEVDIRTLPGDEESVHEHLRAALGDLADAVEVTTMLESPPSTSRTGTPLWSALERAVGTTFPTSRLVPILHMGFTDARVFREKGTVAYGAGLFSPEIDAGEFARRFHGHNERIDVESMRLTANLWPAVARDLLG